MAGAPKAQAVSGEAHSFVQKARGVSYYNEVDYSGGARRVQAGLRDCPHVACSLQHRPGVFSASRYVDALNALCQFVTEGGELIKPKQREITEAELADLLQRVGQVSIDSNLGGATVSVDDQVVGVTPLSKPVAMSAGIRKVTATHEGRSPVELHVSVVGGETCSSTGRASLVRRRDLANARAHRDGLAERSDADDLVVDRHRGPAEVRIDRDLADALQQIGQLRIGDLPAALA